MSGYQSLNDKVAVNQVECLNEDPSNGVGNIFTSTGCLKSDSDQQLLLSIPFQSPVRLNGIKFTFGENAENVPALIKMFVNKVSLDFSDAEAIAPTQILTREDLKSDIIPLKYVLFQNVFSIQIFVEENGGGEISEICGIEFFGTSCENMNMKEFKPIKHDHD